MTKEASTKKTDTELYKRYGFRSNVSITPGEAQKYDEIIARLAKLENTLRTSFPKDADIAKALLSDQYLRETAITIRRTPKNLIELFTDTTGVTTFMTKLMKFTSVRYHEKNNSYAYFKIRSLSIAMTPHNIHRVVAAIKGMTNEQYNVMLQQTDAKKGTNNPFNRNRAIF